MYLAIPASTADLERSFASAAFLLEGRWRLKPRNLEMQVIIRDWLLELERHGELTPKVNSLLSHYFNAE